MSLTDLYSSYASARLSEVTPLSAGLAGSQTPGTRTRPASCARGETTLLEATVITLCTPSNVLHIQRILNEWPFDPIYLTTSCLKTYLH